MFKKATKKQAKLRLALFGVSGGGKTYSALRIAKGLGGKIALIDTEHGSASKYSDRFDFDVCDLEKPTISNILMCMNEAKDYDVLIIDSLTHAWNELLQDVDKIAKAKFGGNNWSAWSEGNQKQTKLINAILDFPGHVICTMRAETNWTTTVNDRGKVVPVRIGEAPKQGKQIEFEFDMLMQISQDHQAVVLKDRTGKFQDECFLIEENFGKQLDEWLQDGEDNSVINDTLSYDNLTVEEAVVDRVDQDPILKLKGDELITAFKERTLKLLEPKQVKLFMKKNNISINDVEGLYNWLFNNDLELTIALFLEEVGK